MLEVFETNDNDAIYATIKRAGRLVKTEVENKYSLEVYYYKGREYHFDLIENICTKIQFENLD